MKNVLIDTDIILDFFLDREPFSDHAAKILTLCENNQLIGFVTPVIVSNVYYILSQNAKQEKVIEKLKLLLSILEIATIDKNIITISLNSDFKDFEDALHNYAAENHQFISVIITRNTKDFKKSNIAVMSPEDFLKSLMING